MGRQRRLGHSHQHMRLLLITEALILLHITEALIPLHVCRPEAGMEAIA